MPVPPVAHLRFGHDAAVRRGEPYAFRVELLSDPKGGAALRGYFLGVVTEHVVLTTSNEASSGSCPGPISTSRAEAESPFALRDSLAHPRAEASIWTR